MTHSGVGNSTVQRFLSHPVSDSLIVSTESGLPGEVKLVGVGERGLEGLNKEGIFTYYQLVAKMFQHNWILEDCTDYLKRIGVAPSFCRSLLIITWNHFRIGERLEEDTTTRLQFNAFSNGRLVASPTADPDEVYIGKIKQEHIKILNEINIRTYYELVGQLFSCRWDRAMFQKFIRDNKLPPELGKIIYEKAYGHINLDLLTGRY